MILVYILRSIALLLREVTLQGCGTNNKDQEQDMNLTISRVLPNQQFDNLKAVSMNVDNLYRRTEERLGLYFKICDLFCKIKEQNNQQIERYDQEKVLAPLDIFSRLFKLRHLKDKLYEYLRTSVQQVIKDESISLHQEDNEEHLQTKLNESFLQDFEEDHFLKVIEEKHQILEVSLFNSWIKHFENEYIETLAINKITERDLLPIFELMTELYDEKIEQYIEKTSAFTMKELQAFYKIRTKILHLRIQELNNLVETQNDDIRFTRSQYTDDILNLKDEIYDLKQMATQLEIIQQSTDFCMHGAQLTSNAFQLQECSFENTQNSQILRNSSNSLYNKIQSRTSIQRQILAKYSTGGVGNSTPVRGGVVGGLPENKRYLQIEEEEKNDQQETKQRRSRRLNKGSQDFDDRSKSNSQLSNHNNNTVSIGGNSYEITKAPNNSNYYQRKEVSVDKPINGIVGEMNKLGHIITEGHLDQIFTQSPIHAQMLRPNNIFSVDESLNYTTNQNSHKKSEGDVEENEMGSKGTNSVQNINMQVLKESIQQTSLPTTSRHQLSININLLGRMGNNDDQFILPTFPSTQDSQRLTTNRDTIKTSDFQQTTEDEYLDEEMNQNLNEEEFEDLLQQRSSSILSQQNQEKPNKVYIDREDYLDQFIDKIEEQVPDESYSYVGEYDIIPEEQDCGTSRNSPSIKEELLPSQYQYEQEFNSNQSNKKSKMIHDRMTPEFKLNSQENEEDEDDILERAAEEVLLFKQELDSDIPLIDNNIINTNNGNNKSNLNYEIRLGSFKTAPEDDLDQYVISN